MKFKGIDHDALKGIAIAMLYFAEAVRTLQQRAESYLSSSDARVTGRSDAWHAAACHGARPEVGRWWRGRVVLVLERRPFVPQPRNEWNSPSGSGRVGVNGSNLYGLLVSKPAIAAALLLANGVSASTALLIAVQRSVRS